MTTPYKRGGRGLRRGKLRGIYATHVPPVDSNLGTVESDEDVDAEMPLTPTVESPTVPSTSSTAADPIIQLPKFTVKKSTDINKSILEQLKHINARLMTMDEKLDRVHKLVDLSYKSTPPTPSSGPKSGVITVTNWD